MPPIVLREACSDFDPPFGRRRCQPADFLGDWPDRLLPKTEGGRREGPGKLGREQDLASWKLYASTGLGGGAGPAWPIRVQVRASVGGTRHPVEVPPVGDALQLVFTSVLEVEPRSDDEVLDR